MNEPQPEPQAAGPEPGRPPLLGPVASGLLSLFLVSSFIIAGPFAFFIAPLAVIPVLRFEAQRGGSTVVWAPVVVILAAVAAAGGGLIAGAVLAAYVLLVVVPTSSVLAWQRLGWSEERWVAVTVLSAAVVLIVVVFAWTQPDGPVEAVNRWSNEAMLEAGDWYETMGLGKAEVQRAISQGQQVVSWSFPSLIIAYLAAVIFWVRPRLALLGFTVPVGAFEAYRSEEWLPLAFAVTGLGTVLTSGSVRWVSLNLLLPVLTLYFIHGLAIIRAHLARWIGRGWLVRWGVTIVALQMPMPVFVAALGLIDAFRPLRPQLNEDGGTQ